MDALTNLAVKYGTDKWGKHHYTPHYFEMFKDRRNEVKNILEIGVAEGAGLRMFQEFFPNANIYGFDNDKSRLFNEDRIVVYEGNQEEPEKMKMAFAGTNIRFDLIVDDGSHVPEHQIETCKEMVSLLSPNGIYVIEDVAKPEVYEELLLTFAYKYSIGVIEVGKRYDDRLVIIRHKNE